MRFRLLAAAAGIVAVSLLLSGALTWLLVRDLALESAQYELDRAAVAARPLVLNQQCFNVPAVPTNPGPAGCRLADALEYRNRLTTLAPAMSGDRLLLLNKQRRIVFDSGSQNTSGQTISMLASQRVANVGEARTTLDGEAYLAAVMQLGATRDPLGGAFLVLAVPQSSVTAAAVSELLPRLVLAGGAALLVALLLVLLVSRSLTQPLAMLAGAAEDIAAGHYSRRVGIRGTDEIGTLGTAFDRMAEAVERARKVQRDFLANVSHELKTPLTSLIGFSQALVEGRLTDQERERAAAIVHEESERVLRMAQELLDLARVEAGTISMHIATVDLGGQLQQELEIVRPRAEGRTLTLRLAQLEGIPPVAADTERLHQILDNLLDNAVKYAPAGSTIAVSARRDGAMVETVVSNPAGDHRPDPDRMFERFYRADPSRSAAAGGVGLGLAISRELAAAMKGRLWANLDPGGNINLHLLLPAAADRAERPTSVAAG